MKPLTVVGLLCLGAIAGVMGDRAVLTPRMQARADTLAYQRGTIDAQNKQLAVRTEHFDTVEVPRWRIIRDSARATPTDTAKVGRALRVADSTISSCRRTLGDCTVLVDSVRSHARTLERQLADALRIKRPALSTLLYGATDLKGGLYLGGEARVRLFGLEAFGRLEQRLDSTSSTVRVGAVIPF